jgi:glucose/arabinose dehydrogenase
VAEPTPPPANGNGNSIVRIVSQPEGALVLIDGRPVGRTPHELQVMASGQGFFRDPISVRVRFLADSPGSESVTVQENFTTLERVPATILFTPQGAQRVAR